MLRFLLDEQISHEVATGLRKLNPAIAVVAMTEWESSRFMNHPDDVILAVAAGHQLVLVTYDRATIPPIIKDLAEQGQPFSGVVFVDQKTIPPNNFGHLIRSLSELWHATKEWNWNGRIYHLKRAYPLQRGRARGSAE